MNSVCEEVNTPNMVQNVLNGYREIIKYPQADFFLVNNFVENETKSAWSDISLNTEQEYTVDLILGTKQEEDCGFSLISLVQSGEYTEADNSFILSLCKSQGYTLHDFKNAEGSRFITTLRRELAGSLGQNQAVTILGKISFADLSLALSGKASLFVPKTACVGLFDIQTGRGGSFAVALERDILLHPRYIYDCIIEQKGIHPALGSGNNKPFSFIAGHARACVGEKYRMLDRAWQKIRAVDPAIALSVE